MKLPILLAIVLAGCATVPTGASPEARIGQTASDGSVRVRPLAVVEDSRCPAEVNCVWAGRLVLLAEIDFKGGSEQWRGNLTLGTPHHYGDETVTLVAAVPTKRAGDPSRPADYRFTFAFSP